MRPGEKENRCERKLDGQRTGECRGTHRQRDKAQRERQPGGTRPVLVFSAGEAATDMLCDCKQSDATCRVTRMRRTLPLRPVVVCMTHCPCRQDSPSNTNSLLEVATLLASTHASSRYDQLANAFIPTKLWGTLRGCDALTGSPYRGSHTLAHLRNQFVVVRVALKATVYAVFRFYQVRN